MLHKTLISLGLGLCALVSLSCNSVITAGSTCPPDQPNCDPNNPGGPGGPGTGEMTTGVGPGGGGSGGGTVPFDPKGDGSTGVSVDPSGNIILDPTAGSSTQQSVIWVANSGDGTVSKIDTRTHKQLARYKTHPGAVNADPSRTTVSLGGDVAVANRSAGASNGSVIKIAGDKGNCIDRNGNGRIDTYEGEANTLPAPYNTWTDEKNPPDECILWFTKANTNAAGTVMQTRPRAAGWDGEITDTSLSQYLYVGLYDSKEVLRIDGATGAIVKRIQMGAIQPYGLALDKNGNVWVMDRGTGNGALAKIEVKNPTQPDLIKTYTGAAGCNYGITVDSRGLVYHAFNKCLARFDPVAEKYELFTINSATQLRGLAIDNKYNLWVADSGVGVHHVDVSALPPATGSSMVYRQTLNTNGTNAGVGIDFDNKTWVVSYSGTSSHAYQVLPGAQPGQAAVEFTYNSANTGALNDSYMYSDMTGYQLRNASRAGTFRTTFQGCQTGNTTWTNLSYSLNAPRGTKVSIRYRGASSTAELSNSPWNTASGTSPVPISVTVPMGQTPRYLQVEVTMTSVDASLTPILSGLSAGFTCSQIIG